MLVLRTFIYLVFSSIGRTGFLQCSGERVTWANGHDVDVVAVD
ncbi:hypothetical protein Gohar_020821, partial [Gossypium harknessii]|nr:hypothetical protein [Gossypium harknessii]